VSSSGDLQVLANTHNEHSFRRTVLSLLHMEESVTKEGDMGGA